MLGAAGRAAPRCLQQRTVPYWEEEAVGIDGYVGDVAYSIKPDTYKTMNRLSEEICVKMIYYTKTKSGLIIEIDD